MHRINVQILVHYIVPKMHRISVGPKLALHGAQVDLAQSLR